MTDLEQYATRFFPNIIEQRSGNTHYFLTQVAGGNIIRRNVEMDGSIEMLDHQRDLLIADAREEFEKVLSGVIDTNITMADGEVYSLENLPEGVTILDVMDAARADGVILRHGGDKVSEKDLQNFIYSAVVKHREKSA